MKLYSTERHGLEFLITYYTHDRHIMDCYIIHAQLHGLLYNFSWLRTVTHYAYIYSVTIVF